VNVLIDSHFSDFYLNKNLQHLLEKIEEQIDLLRTQQSLIQEVVMMENMSQKEVNLKHKKAKNKEENPPEFFQESLYF